MSRFKIASLMLVSVGMICLSSIHSKAVATTQANDPITAQAAAIDDWFCFNNDGKTLYISKIFRDGRMSGGSLIAAFEQLLFIKYKVPITRTYGTRCVAQYIPGKIQIIHENWRKKYAISMIEDVNWPTGPMKKLSPKADSTKSKPSQPGSLTVEDTGIAAQTKAWKDAVFQGQREEAQRKVAAAVVSARQDAKIKALIAAEMEKMRKRGNKQ